MKTSPKTIPGPKRRLLISTRPKSLLFSRRTVQELFRALDRMTEWPVPPGELSIAFLSDAALAELHGRFLDDPTPTDVITFPGDPDMDFAGEICVSWERAIAEAKARNCELRHELTLYLAHGWLHLAGLDDQAENERAAMRRAEEQIMSRITAANLLPNFSSRLVF